MKLGLLTAGVMVLYLAAPGLLAQTTTSGSTGSASSNFRNNPATNYPRASLFAGNVDSTLDWFPLSSLRPGSWRRSAVPFWSSISR